MPGIAPRILTRTKSSSSFVLPSARGLVPGCQGGDFGLTGVTGQGVGACSGSVYHEQVPSSQEQGVIGAALWCLQIPQKNWLLGVIPHMGRSPGKYIGLVVPSSQRWRFPSP